jgi:hypothetical protein
MKALVLALVLGAAIAHPAVADNNDPVVKLIDAGKAPLKPLRLTAKKGLKKTVTMRMKMGLSMDLGNGAPMAQDVPPIEMVFAVKVTDVAANGDIRYDTQFKRPKVIANALTSPAIVEALNDAFKDLEGIGGYTVVTNRGFIKEVKLDVPENTAPQFKQMLDSMKQSMSQVASPFPDEAVGVGAKWDTITKVATNGLEVQQTASLRIVSLNGNKATLDVVLVQTATPQTFTASGVTANLASYASDGHGKTVFDLAGLIPQRATVGMKSEIKMSAAGQNIGMKLSMDVVMQAK